MMALRFKSLLWAGFAATVLSLSACGGDSDSNSSSGGSSGKITGDAFEQYTAVSKKVTNAKSLAWHQTTVIVNNDQPDQPLYKIDGNFKMNNASEDKLEAFLEATEYGDVIKLYITRGMIYALIGTIKAKSPLDADDISSILAYELLPTLDKGDVSQSSIEAQGNERTITLTVPSDSLGDFYSELGYVYPLRDLIPNNATVTMKLDSNDTIKEVKYIYSATAKLGRIEGDMEVTGTTTFTQIQVGNVKITFPDLSSY